MSLHISNLQGIPLMSILKNRKKKKDIFVNFLKREVIILSLRNEIVVVLDI